MARPIAWLVAVAFLSAIFAAARAPENLPKVAIAAKGPTAAQRGILPLDFGSTCRARSDAKSAFYNSYKPVSIAEAMGAPIRSITITSYGSEWKDGDQLRSTVLRLLAAQTNDFAPGIEWEEGVWTDLVGTIRFTDGKNGAFEESSGHVCFNDHNGAVIFSRVRLDKTQ